MLRERSATRAFDARCAADSGLSGVAVSAAAATCPREEVPDPRDTAFVRAPRLRGYLPQTVHCR